MRGNHAPQSDLFSYIAPDKRVPAEHPLRIIKAVAYDVLASLSPTFDAMYSRWGRPSIPPERLLKAQFLITLYSVRSFVLFRVSSGIQ
jgi:transposase